MILPFEIYKATKILTEASISDLYVAAEESESFDDFYEIAKKTFGSKLGKGKDVDLFLKSIWRGTHE